MEANGFQRSAVYVALNAANKLQLTLHLVNKATNLGHMNVVFIDKDSLWTDTYESCIVTEIKYNIIYCHTTFEHVHIYLVVWISSRNVYDD